MRTPFIVAMLPGQLIKNARERDNHVIDSPSDNKIVVEHNNTGDYDHPIAQTAEKWAELVVNCNRSESSVLPK